MTRRLIALAALIAFIVAAPLRAEAAAIDGEFLSHAMNQHNAIMLLIEPDSGRIVDANDAAIRFYGFPIDELRRMRIQDINTLGPDEVAKERAKAKADRRNYFIFPHRLASGDIRTVEVYSAPVKSDGGRVFLFSIIHDISGKAVAESELASYRAHLEDLVTKRTQEALDSQSRLRLWLILGLAAQSGLIIALILAYRRRRAALHDLAHEAQVRRRAEEKLHAAKLDLQRFAEISAHHLQEPTRRIIVFSQRLRKFLAGRTDDNVEFTLKTLEDQAGYLHALVRDVQIYLAADTPLAPIDFIDPGRVAAGVVAEMAIRVHEHQAKIEIRDMPPLRMDAPRLRYLMSALLDNALRYADKTAPEIVVDGETLPDGGALIRISDNGPGIPEEYRTRVLEVFEHLHHGDKGSPGTGLGLAVARRIVESLDGRIEIGDSAGGGAAIIITLPQGELD